jgi:hypothetical protein
MSVTLLTFHDLPHLRIRDAGSAGVQQRENGMQQRE